MLVVTLLFIPLSACVSSSSHYRDLTVTDVDIPRFMGKWYVLASIPTAFEEGAVNGIEEYRLEGDGSIYVSFKFRSDSAQGEQNEVSQQAWIVDEKTKAHWKIRPIWPLLFDYLIIALDERDYQYTVVGRPGRENMWLMARQPNLAPEVYERLIEKVVIAGYEREKIVRIRQEW